MFLTDKGNNLVRIDVPKHIEPAARRRGNTIQQSLRLPRTHRLFQSAAGKLHPALRHILTRDQHLLEFFENLVFLLGGHDIELGDLLGDPLDLHIRQILHHLGGRLLTQGNHQDRDFGTRRQFFVFFFCHATIPSAKGSSGASPPDRGPGEQLDAFRG